MTAVAISSSRRTRGAGATVTLCLVQFVDVLGVTVVATALPPMLSDVGAQPSAGTFIATGYAMCFGGLLMFGARLGDRIGHRRTIVGSLLVFAAGDLLAALAPTLALLTVARCLQGASAAAAVPAALRLLTALADDERRRARALAAWSAAGAAAGASGFVVGGLVSASTSWRVIFWALVPAAGLLAFAVLRTVPAAPATQKRRPLGLPSSALLTGAVMASVVGATELGRPGQVPVGVALVAVALALGGAFVVVDRRAPEPLIPAPLVRHPRLRRGVAGSFLNTATTSSVGTLVTLYVQDTLGHSPLLAAGALLPFSVAVVAGASLAAPLLTRRRAEWVAAVGLALIAVADGGLVPAGSHLVAVGACMAAAGLGIGLSSVASTSLGMDVPDAEQATASGIVNTAAQLGTAVGVAAVLLIAAVSTGVPAGGTPAPVWAEATAASWAAAGAIAFRFLAARRSQVTPTGSGAAASR
jgi:MFS family permease